MFWALLWFMEFRTIISRSREINFAKGISCAHFPSWIIHEHNILGNVLLEWNLFSSLSSFGSFQVHSKRSMSPSLAFTTISSRVSLRSPLLSSSITCSFTASHSANVMILWFVQSKAKWPNPWHLKHLWMPLGIGSGLFWCGWLFSGAVVFWGWRVGEPWV